MLRRQSPHHDKSSFLSGPSEMAARIRDFDWSDHPLGSPETWPPALRLSLGIALNSAFPTCIYWGPELRLLYNDSWSDIPGPRHPACLGEPAEEVWSDIWHIIEPQFAQVITTGQGVHLQDQLLPMRRFGVDEETYWTYNFTPILLDDGSIGGIFNSGSETTRQVLQHEKAQLLLDLSDLYRNNSNIEEVCARSLELLGEQLVADRVGLRIASSGSDNQFPITAQWSAKGIAPIVETSGGAPFYEDIWNELLDGHVIRLDGTDETRHSRECDILAKLGCAAALAVPWVEDGRTVAILFVHSYRPRHWTPIDIETVEAVLARMMMMMERSRAAERATLMNREINHRSRNLLAVVTAMVRLSRVEAPDVMRSKLLDRIAALSRNNSLLLDRSWERVTLRQILDQELAPYKGNDKTELDLEGPEIELTSDASQAIGMVLHELATNAAKYGALKDIGGKVSVHWELTPEHQLCIRWTETCPETIDVDGLSDIGFGSKLQELMVERQLGGHLRRELTPDGLHCVIELPWEDVSVIRD